MPLLEREKPGLVLISAGQDVLSDDPVGSSRDLAPEDMAGLTGRIVNAIDMPLNLVLEGGY